MTLTGRVPPNAPPHPRLGSGDTELIADSRCVSNCGGARRPGNVSVSAVLALARKQRVPLLLLITGLISVNRLVYRSPPWPARWEHRGAADSALDGRGGENNEARQGRRKKNMERELTEGVGALASAPTPPYRLSTLVFVDGFTRSKAPHCEAHWKQTQRWIREPKQ